MPSSATPHERARLARTLKLLCGVLFLAWAFQVSGMSQATKLWTNRQRAADYILGQRVDASTLATRRDEALREVRTEMQLRARDEIVAEFKAKSEPTPSFMKLMGLAEQQASARLRDMSKAELDALVDQRLAAQGVAGDRRGGYLPPETSPRAIFGDPNDLGRLSGPVQWIVNRADHAGGWVRTSTRWIIAAFTDDAGYTGALLETIAIAVWGTLLAVLLAIPAALLGAERTLQIILPGRARWQQGLRGSTRFFIRRTFDIARGFNEIVLAMILVAVLGLGPLPGVLALLIHTYGVLGKVFSEAMETTDPKPIEGVQSTGARATQVVMFAVLPQITPYVVSQSLLRFESNVRGATILGVVGAGGIGQLLMDKFGAYKFPEVATMMIIIIVVVTLIDFACGRVMKRVA